LVKSASRPDAARWTGLAITDVVPAGSIQRIVMTRAITSAPGDVDLGNIRSLLSGTYGPARPQERPDPRGVPQLGGAASIWEGVVVLESGA
ncbi:hypothetical protein, partial [Bacillus sp. SIMBA_005]|uniref:hypothetical protein n=1 Tax=Bacillus sp. SIMBA_005 TaxID=3085754 RepID=UPI003978D424